MAHTFLIGVAPTFHRIDLPPERTGFSTPPFDIHIKLIPAPDMEDGWTLFGHAAAGKPDMLARWLRAHPGIGEVTVAPGIAPKLLQARVTELPPAWATVASFAKVHHLDLAADGHACWFIEGARDRIAALKQHLDLQQTSLADDVARFRQVHDSGNDVPISRRQFAVLSAAVALGYYEIPHRVDLRTIARKAGISLGSVAELLRRAEGAVLMRYVDSALMNLHTLAQESSASVDLPVRTETSLAPSTEEL
jgi:hypothetical protein